MGKLIDRFVLTSLLAGGFYIFFQHSFENRLLSIPLAVLGCAIVSRLLRGLRRWMGKCGLMQKYQMRRCAQSRLMTLACMPQEEATALLRKALHARYDGDYGVELVQAPPSASLSQQALFSVWRQHRGEDKLVVCASCACDASCQNLAASLQAPRIALLSGEALARLLSDWHDFPAPAKELRLRQRLRAFASLMLNRKNAPRCLVLCFSMFVLYMLSGSASYLLTSLFLLGALLLSLRQKPCPARLF